jgi:hypothetical protein
MILPENGLQASGIDVPRQANRNDRSAVTGAVNSVNPTTDATEMADCVANVFGRNGDLEAAQRFDHGG